VVAIVAVQDIVDVHHRRHMDHPTVRTATDSLQDRRSLRRGITLGDSRRSEAKPHWCRVRQRSPVYQLTKGCGRGRGGCAMGAWVTGP
jgi:hypothetical protein